ncbi:MAG TPA: PhoH family protein [Bacillota bacterium]|nr:PhoH family protein [Bacillota bacterium]
MAQLPKMIEEKLVVGSGSEAASIFGYQDEHLNVIEKEFEVKLVARGNEIVIQGTEPEVDRVRKVFQELQGIARKSQSINAQEVRYIIRLVKEGQHSLVSDVVQEVVFFTAKGKPIKPKTLGQKGYIEAIRQNDLVFGIGPAGTGKTYLAVVMAVHALKNRRVSRIVLTRPAVEAGEKLGFLPGDLQEKVDPYLRPLYDSLYDVLGAETTQKYLERGVIEIAPLAYMRGRTLEDSFIILDEAQNTTTEQMKMFLTRIGLGSKAVITGDVTQVDLPRGQFSGLIEVQRILKDITGIAFYYLSESDVVRHPLVQKIVEAYRMFALQDND